MLLAKLKENNVTIESIQFAIIIVVGSHDYMNATKRLIEFDTERIKAFINERREAEKPQTIDIVKETIDYLFQQKVHYFNEDSQLPELFSEVVGRGQKAEIWSLSVNQIFTETYGLIMNNSLLNYVGLFYNTKYCTDCMMPHIRRACARCLGVKNINGIVSETTLQAILDAAKDWTIHFSSHFYFSSGCSPVGWITTSFNDFCKNRNNLYQFLNERNQDAIIGASQDTTALELASIHDKHLKKSINFIDCTTKIAKASNVLYSHKKSINAYCDIFTKYNERRVNTVVANLKKMLGVHASDYYIKNSWSPSEELEAHLIAKKNNRDAVANIMEVILTDNIPENEIYRLYQSVLAQDSSAPLSANGSVKDGVRLFVAKDSWSKSNFTNGELFKILYDGYYALKDFLEYLDVKGIDPLSISPKIFRSLRAPRRFWNLSEYLELGPTVFELVQEAELLDDSKRECINSVQQNDSLYDRFCIGFKKESNLLDSYLRNSCTLGDIKIALQQQEEERMKEAVDIKATSLYKDVKSDFSYFALHVMQAIDPQTRKGKTFCKMIQSDAELESVRLKEKQPSQTARSLVLPMFYKDEDYAHYLNSLTPELETNEHKKTFIEDYSKSLNFTEQRLIMYGAYSKMSAKQREGILDYLYYAFGYHTMNGDIENDKHSFIKLALAYLSCYKVVAQDEGNPVVEKGYYNYNSANLPFSHLMVDKDGKPYPEELSAKIEAQINKRKACLEACHQILVGVTCKNDVEMIQQVYIAASIYSAYGEKIINILKDISHSTFLSNKERDAITVNVSAYNKFIADGAFAALLRGAIHNNFIRAKRPATRVEQLPLYLNLELYHGKPSMQDPYVMSSKDLYSFVLKIANAFYEEYSQIFDYFDYLITRMDNEFYTTSAASSKVVTGKNREILEKEAVTLRQMERTWSVENADVRHRISNALKHSAIYDSNGYVLIYGNYYLNNGRYLHNSGYWISIENGVSCTTEMTLLEFEQLSRRILNATYN